MTVHELKEKLEQFPENYVVLVTADAETRRLHDGFPYVQAEHVGRGLNELDGCVIIDGYVEDEDDEL